MSGERPGGMGHRTSVTGEADFLTSTIAIAVDDDAGSSVDPSYVRMASGC